MRSTTMLLLVREIAARFTPRRYAVVGAAFVAVLGASLANDEYVRSGWESVPTAALVLVSLAAIVASAFVPRTAAIISIVVMALGCIAGGAVVSHLIAMLITALSASYQTDRRTAIGIGVGALAVTAPALVAFLPGEWSDFRAILQLAAFLGFAVAAGDAARSRRAVIDSLTERTRRAEETAEAEARRRVAEERVRIARDLHDLMAHQIAVINLQANVASQAIATRPNDAERSLATIRDAARTVLGEIGGLLSVLRAGDSDARMTQTMPTPGLDALDDLVDDMRRGGLDVEVREIGDRITLSAASDVVAYRVIQEALTNAQKHGNDSSALLQLEWGADGLEITVTNRIELSDRAQAVSAGRALADRSGVDRPMGGHGLLGVRERVLSVGGRADASRGPGPVHRFSAWVPVDDVARRAGNVIAAGVRDGSP